MIELKKDAEARVPVRIYDVTTGLPVTGVLFSAVTVSVEKADGTTTTLSILTGDWAENAAGAFVGTGKYTLLLPASATDVPGCLVYAVAGVGLKAYMGAVKVVDYEEIDTFTRLGTPVLSSVTEDIAAIATSEQRILDLTEGRWKLDKILKQMIIYKPDGVTELRRFALFNDLGAPDVDVVFDKVPMP